MLLPVVYFPSVLRNPSPNLSTLPTMFILYCVMVVVVVATVAFVMEWWGSASSGIGNSDSSSLASNEFLDSKSLQSHVLHSTVGQTTEKLIFNMSDGSHFGFEGQI